MRGTAQPDKHGSTQVRRAAALVRSIAVIAFVQGCTTEPRFDGQSSAFDEQGETWLTPNSPQETTVRLLLDWLSEELMQNVQSGRFYGDAGSIPLEAALPYEHDEATQSCDMSMGAMIRHARSRLGLEEDPQGLSPMRLGLDHGELGIAVELENEGLSLHPFLLRVFRWYPRFGQAVLAHEFQHIQDQDCTDLAGIDDVTEAVWSERRGVFSTAMYVMFGGRTVARPSDRLADAMASRFDEDPTPQSLAWYYGLDLASVSEIEHRYSPQMRDDSDPLDYIAQAKEALSRLLQFASNTTNQIRAIPDMFAGNFFDALQHKHRVREAILDARSRAEAQQTVVAKISHTICSVLPAPCEIGSFPQRVGTADLKEVGALIEKLRQLAALNAHMLDEFQQRPDVQQSLGVWPRFSWLRAPAYTLEYDFSEWLYRNGNSATQALDTFEQIAPLTP